MRRHLRRLPLFFGLLLGLGPFLAGAAERPALFHTPPPVARPGEPLAVEGMLVRGERVDKLLLHFRGPNQPYQTVPMEAVYGDLFRGTIPSDKVAAPGVEYYVDGVIDDGTKVPLFMNDARPARVLVVPGARVPKPPPTEAPVPAHPEEKPAEVKPPAEKAPAEAKPPAEKAPVEKAPVEAKPPAEKAPSEAKATSEPGRGAEKTPSEVRTAPDRTTSEPRIAERGTEGRSSERKPLEPEPVERKSSRSRKDRRSSEAKTPERLPDEGVPDRGAEAKAPERGSDTHASERALETKPPPGRRTPESKPAERAPPEPPSEPPPSEPAPGRRAEPSEREPAATPGRPMSELEEELSLYSAEDRSGITPRQEPQTARVPQLTTSVSRDEMLAMGARSVYDVLSLMPGISISRDVAGFYRTGVRGSRNDAQVLFLLNGHVLNNFYDGKALANIPVENLERIEVILGPGPAQYGLGAFDAVVNIFTRREEGIQAALSVGTYASDRTAPTTSGLQGSGGLDLHATALKPLGGLKIFGDVDLLASSGSSRRVDKDSLDLETLSQGYREDPLDPAGFTKDDRQFLNVGAGLVYESEGVGKLTLSTRFMGEDRAALVGLFDTLGNGSRLKWQLFGADLSYELVLAPKALGHARFSFDDQYTDRLYQLSPGAVPATPEHPAIPGFTTADSLVHAAPDQIFPKGLLEGFRVGVRTFGLDLGGDVALAGSNQLSVGLTAQEQVVYDFNHVTNYHTGADGTLRHNADDTNLVRPAELPDLDVVARSRLALALYAQDKWSLLPNLTAIFGIRVEALQLPVVTKDNKFTGDTALQPNFAPRVGVAYAVTPALVLKGSYSRATRAPTVQELTEAVIFNDFDRGRVAGFPGLLSPTMDLVEAGADLVQVSGESRVRLRGNVFYQRVSNAIALVDTTGNVVPMGNRNLVTTWGGEAEARLDVSRRTRAWLNASFFHAEDAQSRSSFKLLTDTPQARFNAGLSMPLGDWLNLDVAVEIGAERRNNSRSSLEALRRYQLPAYSLVTAQLRTETIADRFTFALVVHNAFQTDLVDDAYRPDRMPGGVPREGLSAFLTVRTSL